MPNATRAEAEVEVVQLHHQVLAKRTLIALNASSSILCSIGLLLACFWICRLNRLKKLRTNVNQKTSAVYANWEFARIKGCGWGWAGVIWLHNIVFYRPLDVMKFAIRYILSGKAWDSMIENKVGVVLLEPSIHLLSPCTLHLCDSTCVVTYDLFGNILLSQPKRIMEKKKGRLSGQLLSRLYMDFRHLLLQLVTYLRMNNYRELSEIVNKRRRKLNWQGSESSTH